MEVKAPLCFHTDNGVGAAVTFFGVIDSSPMFYIHKDKKWTIDIDEIKRLAPNGDWLICFRPRASRKYNMRTHIRFVWNNITFCKYFVRLSLDIPEHTTDSCCVVRRHVSSLFPPKKRRRQTLLLDERADMCAVCFGKPSGAERLRVPSCRRPLHAVCTNCLTLVVQDSTTHPVREGHPYVGCLAPTPWTARACGGHFPISVFASILPGQALQQLVRRIRRYSLEPSIACVCGNEATFSQGSSLMHCHSGKHTCCVWCWSITCPGCRENSQLPHAPNRFFGGVRNSAISPLLVAKTIRRIQQQEVWTRPHCPDCDVPLHKTSACNELSHCGRAICNVCGACSLPWEPPHLPSSHWSVDGSPGCPRFDVADWAVKCGYICVEGTCFTDEIECSVSSHQPGIRRMHAARKQRMLLALHTSTCHNKI